VLLDVSAHVLVALLEQSINATAAHECFIELMMRLDVLEEARQAWQRLVFSFIKLSLMLAECVEHARKTAHQQIFFVQVVRVERRAPGFVP